MTAFDPRHFKMRWLIFSLLLTLPILRMLLQKEYGFVHAEVGVAVGLAIGGAAVLAAVTRTSLLLHIVTIAVILVMSVNAVRADFLPEARPRLLLPTMAIAIIVAIFVLRQNFYKLLTIFLAASFAADVAKATFERIPGSTGDRPAAASQKYSHVVHIILDEMMGLEGAPSNCSDCQIAREELRDALRRGNFRAYPYAFSNYAVTRDSIPSILNADILDRCHEYFPLETRRMILSKNTYFDEYQGRNYDIRIYQSDDILFSAPRFRAVERTYKVHNLKALHSLDLRWTERLQELMIVYLRSDSLWREWWSRLMPARFQSREKRVGPLSMTEIWPSQIVDDVRRATRNTLFFAHLLTPHAPFIYNQDGSVRPYRDWSAGTDLERRWFREEDKYLKTYATYAQQVRFVARQLADFVDALRAAGQYDSTTIILHGDHGPRLRLVFPEREDATAGLPSRECHPVNRYHYTSDPDTQDLLNTFATLFAIKPAGAHRPETVNDRGSVTYFLWKEFFPKVVQGAGPELNSVYLFDKDRRPIAIPLTKLW